MPLSWGRRYCVYKYQGFLFYIVTLVLSMCTPQTLTEAVVM